MDLMAQLCLVHPETDWFVADVQTTADGSLVLVGKPDASGEQQTRTLGCDTSPAEAWRVVVELALASRRPALERFCKYKLGKSLETIAGDGEIILEWYELDADDVISLDVLAVLGFFCCATILDMRRTVDVPSQMSLRARVDQRAQYWPNLCELRVDDEQSSFKRRRDVGDAWVYF